MACRFNLFKRINKSYGTISMQIQCNQYTLTYQKRADYIRCFFQYAVTTFRITSCRDLLYCSCLASVRSVGGYFVRSVRSEGSQGAKESKVSPFACPSVSLWPIISNQTVCWVFVTVGVEGLYRSYRASTSYVERGPVVILLYERA
jgi:hypothetical protein